MSTVMHASEVSEQTVLWLRMYRQPLRRFRAVIYRSG